MRGDPLPDWKRIRQTMRQFGCTEKEAIQILNNAPARIPRKVLRRKIV
jgi:hypothetical protein